MRSVPLSPYQVLGIDQTASAAVVRQAYQRALREGTHPHPDVTRAFHQLRNPRSRLDQDLVEPEPLDSAGALEPILAPLRAQRFVSAATAPPPAWESLVVLDRADPPRLWRDIPPPTSDYRTGRHLDPPGSEVLPPLDFPV